MGPNSPATVTKKLWNYVRIVLFMLRKGVSKRKLMMDLHLMMKRGKFVGKAIGNLMFHHHHHHSNSICQSHDANLTFVAPSDYEFSCSNSPAFPPSSSSSSSSFFPFHISKRKTSQNHSHSHSHSHHYFSCMHPRVNDDDITAVNAVQKVLEMLNDHDITEASPIPSPFFGFGKSPMVRQLRITDSPFPLTNSDEDSHVDKAAEEFIQKFYNNLRLQNSMDE
ncbi:uncharacterized protein LOC122058197 [Macadamia integrifolia]|uniref:uncharacterized protein LOC122058197 n=1 Tax=Macadamia integrifolia TaxID=60698 RepID=UPI001C4EFF56|nr:uncharacterized protein LOC122058197 [Macadamia integrifolia]